MHPFTNEQKDLFVKHLANCHSWYKHLSLLNGGQFIILIDENAGKNYPTSHPKLPFGNTQENYQKTFGLLNYFWSNNNDGRFYSDGSNIPMTEQEIKNQFIQTNNIRLFPFISDEFMESIHFHDSDFQKIISDKEHEYKKFLIELKHTHDKMEELWQSKLTKYEKDIILNESYDLTKDSLLVTEYHLLETKIQDILYQLKLGEINKIKISINELSAPV